MDLQPQSSTRIEVVDALRGFAIMAILLVHSLEHFIYPVYPMDPPSWLETLDQGVFNILFALFAGKAYAIFALLFGFTFYIQMSNQQVKGKDFGYRFLWRLVLLVGFATLNAAFFPGGDVLLLFALVGPVLFFLRNRSDRSILLVAVLCLFQPLEWGYYVAHLIHPAFQVPDLRVGDMYAQVADYVKTGHIKDFFIGNVTLGQKASLLWAVGAGRLFQTAGLFLLGFYIGRKQWFVASEKSLGIWVKVLIVSALAFAPLLALKEQAMQFGTFVQQSIGIVFDMWHKLTFTLVLVSSFVLLYQYDRFRHGVRNLRCYGRMSLTNYVTQSIIGAMVYFPLGLHLAPHCGYTISLLIGIVTFLLQLYVCKWWLSGHRQGPLESLWHTWTWMGTKSS